MAAVLIAIETAAEVVLIASQDHRTVALRVALILVVGAKVLFLRGAFRQRPASMFGLLVYQGTAVLAWAAADVAPVVRVGLLVLAVASIWLLVASLSWFPHTNLRTDRP